MDARRGVRRLLGRARSRAGGSSTLEINGVTMRFPVFRGMRCVISDDWMLDLVREVLGMRSGAVLDVGVNLGQTLVKLKALDPARTYVGFEPNPACVFYVQELVRTNGFEHCSIVPVALFSEDGIAVLDLHASGVASEAASLIPGFRPTREARTRMFVPVFMWETVARQLDVGDVALVKIDVEGAELEVMSTLRAVLVRDRPLVLVEVLPSYTADNVARIERQAMLESLITEIEYEMFRVVKTRERRLDGLLHVHSIGVQADLDGCDYLLVPAEHSTDVISVVEGRPTTAP